LHKYYILRELINNFFHFKEDILKIFANIILSQFFLTNNNKRVKLSYINFIDDFILQNMMFFDINSFNKYNFIVPKSPF